MNKIMLIIAIILLLTSYLYGQETNNIEQIKSNLTFMVKQDKELVVLQNSILDDTRKFRNYSDSLSVKAENYKEARETSFHKTLVNNQKIEQIQKIRKELKVKINDLANAYGLQEFVFELKNKRRNK